MKKKKKTSGREETPRGESQEIGPLPEILKEKNTKKKRKKDGEPYTSHRPPQPFPFVFLPWSPETALNSSLSPPQLIPIT